MATTVRAILQILRDNKLYAKVEKCEFNKDSMAFVGYMVSKAGIGMDPAKGLRYPRLAYS